MVRLTRKLFHDLAIWMIGLGVLVGVIFPFFTVLMGVSPETALSPWFFEACISAGVIVGACNVQLARVVVGRRLHLLADRMKTVETSLRTLTADGASQVPAPEACCLEVDSEDEIGQSAQAFNSLVTALVFSHRTEAAVRAFTELLSSQLELDVLTARALQHLLAHTGATAGAVLVEIDGEMRVAASHGIRSPEGLAGSDHVRRALRSENTYRLDIPADVAIEGVLTEFRPREVLIEPVFYKRLPLGVIILASASGFTDEVRTRLDLFGNSMGLALNNALVHERLQRLAALDPLTGAYNRRFGLARLHEEFGRAVRAGSPVGVLMFDLDHFKQINDTYGHLVGDRLLIQIVRLARSVLREGDVLVRYGGEEFLAILPAASRADLQKVAERLRRTVEEAAMTDGGQMIRVTLSVGGVSYPQFDVSGDQDLVKRADELLYAAKQAGRNRAMIA